MVFPPLGSVFPGAGARDILKETKCRPVLPWEKGWWTDRPTRAAASRRGSGLSAPKYSTMATWGNSCWRNLRNDMCRKDFLMVSWSRSSVRGPLWTPKRGESFPPKTEEHLKVSGRTGPADSPYSWHLLHTPHTIKSVHDFPLFIMPHSEHLVLSLLWVFISFCRLPCHINLVLNKPACSSLVIYYYRVSVESLEGKRKKIFCPFLQSWAWGLPRVEKSVPTSSKNQRLLLELCKMSNFAVFLSRDRKQNPLDNCFFLKAQRDRNTSSCLQNRQVCQPSRVEPNATLYGPNKQKAMKLTGNCAQTFRPNVCGLPLPKSRTSN